MKLMNSPVIFFTLATSLLAVPQDRLPTLWDATVIVGGLTIPFRLEITHAGAAVSGAFFNGDERVRSTAGSFENGRLTLEFAHYATTLQAKWDGTALTGAYHRNGGSTRPPYPFQATPYQRTAASADGEIPDIAGLWELTVNSPKGESAWKFNVRQSGPEVAAIILRIDGDTGTLAGSYRDGRFVLSHFSGARPNLVEVTANAGGTLTVVQNAKSAYRAVRSAAARAQGLPEPADPTRWTSVADASQPLRFTAPDLSGRPISESDPLFQGKVVLLNITGSWCPNCHDEAPFLADLYRKYRHRGLEIIALSFEEAEQLQQPDRLKAFVRTYGIEYTVLLGGTPDDVKAKLPQAVNLNTWPATFFIGRDGLVRGAHAGFASRAAGPEHERVKADFVAKVEKLLVETVREAR